MTEGFIPIDVGACRVASTGGPLAVFSDGASATPGVQVTNSETWGVRWNNHATPDPIATNIPLPSDLDPRFPIVFHCELSKTGATAADATTVTVAAFFTGPGDLHDADADAGGATNAVDGDATAKTKTELTYTIDAADIPQPPATLALSFGPTDDLLDTDDAVIHSAWLTYTRRSGPIPR